ncbi:MAG: multidrug effflux MFS transporter [Proteobacteria bacterium]|nr:multidrug effflux MFS transporter [Pseudomonadota bacterium]MBU1388426.1 multidrug effflux MFS transporter [Pseudomonadota bacterium]MBU1542750.1 multidrug effflux MFS transporter [Pseudomonadota bacterium]
MSVPQKYLSKRGMLLMLALISCFPPVSTDLYLPALPGMMEGFGVTQAKLNLSLSLFFVFFAFAILIWGPLSDKYGRKPILVTGLLIYIFSSMMCAVSRDVNHLIFFRICQALGGGAATAVSTAVVKDCFSGFERARVLAIIMSIVILAPVVAPLLGAFLLKISSWRAIFWVLAGVGILALAASFLLQETLPQKYQGSTMASLGRLFVVLKNPGFSCLLGTFSIITIPLMGFLAASSYIYVNGFGLSEQQFSFYFSLNAACAMAGPLLYIRFSRKLEAAAIITACYASLLISGIFIIFFGTGSPAMFALFMCPATLSIMVMRPPSANLMLEQQDEDTGSASALINFSGMIMGSMGMFMVSFWSVDVMIPVLGSLQITIGLVGGLLWLVFRKRPFVRYEKRG